MSLNGIDISSWQNDIDLSKIKCDFVIVKATEGISYVSPSCDKQFQSAKKLGRLLGFYHFARPETNDALKEAQYFYKNTSNYFKEAIPFLDWESEGKANVAWAKKWLDEVYRLSGVKPLIYMSESVVNSYNWKAVADAGYGLWVAKYKDYNADRNFDMYDAGPRPSVRYWSKYWLWQWTSSGYIDGYGNRLDCDIFYGTAEDWKSLITGKTNKPEIPEEKKSVTELAAEVIRGKWGVGEDRKNRLEAAGYNYEAVQKKVNEIIYDQTINRLAREVLDGKWGNGLIRKHRLKKAGYDYDAVQKRVNEILSK